MVLVPISEAESSLRHQEMAASAKHQHHHSLAEESVCDKDSDSENGSTSTSCKKKRTGVEKGDQSLPLTRNLRLRNAAGRCRARAEIDSQLPKGTAQVKSSRSSKTARNKPAVNKKKPKKFSVALSQEEIADDIFAMTGSKPSRRPIKRDKKVQQTVDNISPGFWLHTITPSSYNLKVVIFTILIGRTPGGIRFLLDQS
ncbi:hypothetical protein CK203_041320 [Vitis vinifera]|uniref:Uncharacterized protein n=1 Tax=Vitis vinifera TaxID=29760 RepID=A0A438HJ10_VITVI|nr:hypothetical protein CK203_041320 [Vitis vinifera]